MVQFSPDSMHILLYIHAAFCMYSTISNHLQSAWPSQLQICGQPISSVTQYAVRAERIPIHGGPHTNGKNMNFNWWIYKFWVWGRQHIKFACGAQGIMTKFVFFIKIKNQTSFWRWIGKCKKLFSLLTKDEHLFLYQQLWKNSVALWYSVVHNINIAIIFTGFIVFVWVQVQIFHIYVALKRVHLNSTLVVLEILQ